MTSVLLSALIVIAMSVTMCSRQWIAPPPPDQPTTQTVKIANQEFDLELALDPNGRYEGLSNRKEVAADGGMLFVFPEPDEVQFVMRDCLVPIDVMFIDAAGQIVSTHAMEVEPVATRSQPDRYYASGAPIQYAIELKGGLIAKLGLKKGDSIPLPFDSLKRRAR